MIRAKERLLTTLAITASAASGYGIAVDDAPIRRETSASSPQSRWLGDLALAQSANGLFAANDLEALGVAEAAAVRD
jgi:hypothetical protein